MRRTTNQAREDAVLHFDRSTRQFRVVCEPHTLSYPAETTFDARLLLELHNTAHADATSDLYLPEAAATETRAEHAGRLLRGLRVGLELSLEATAALAGVTGAQILAAEEGRLEDGTVQQALSMTYSAVAAGLSNARRA